MGKRNNINDKIHKLYTREDHLNNSLKEDEIQILEKINNSFVSNFVKFLSDLLNNNIECVSYNLKIESYDFKNNYHLQCYNLLEISPYQETSFILFYNNFLSVIVDILFGGLGNYLNQNNSVKNISDTEIVFNKKIIEFITCFFSQIYHKYFHSEINFIDKKIFFNGECINFDKNSIFFIKNFNFKINNIDIFFDILIPKIIIDQLIKKSNSSISNDNVSAIKNKNKISFKDIQDVELNIVAQIPSLSILKEELYTLSKGDVLPINKPNKIIGYIENQPVFLADYKRLNEKSIIFIEEFINSTV